VVIETEQLLSTAVAAKRIGVSTRRILQLADAKILPAHVVKDGRYDRYVFTREDVDKFAKTRKAGRE
jgi:excisionase family DNA binding protein